MVWESSILHSRRFAFLPQGRAFEGIKAGCFALLAIFRTIQNIREPSTTFYYVPVCSNAVWKVWEHSGTLKIIVEHSRKYSL